MIPGILLSKLVVMSLGKLIKVHKRCKIVVDCLRDFALNWEALLLLSEVVHSSMGQSGIRS